jgi:Gpi18-like mannosyltransferase
MNYCDPRSVPTTVKPAARAEWLLILALIALAALARTAGLHTRTGDMVIFEGWYQHLVERGGWRGLGTVDGNYNAPFLYMLALALLIPGPVILKIKAVFIAFDVVLAFFTYKLVGLRRPGRVAIVAALVTVLLPTVVINASLYGQMDAMWASFAVGGVYFLARGRGWWGVALCTISVAIKPQGIFIFPLVLLLVLAGRLKWPTLLAAPVVFLGLDLPAVVLGRHPLELLTIYSMSRQARHVPSLTLHAPSAYAFVPPTAGGVPAVRTLGYVFAAALVLGVCYVLIARRVPLTPERIVTAATLFAILVPFTLPGMHERYFFLADVLSVALAFYRPRLWFVPLLVQTSSLLAYEAYLFHAESVPLPAQAGLMLAALLTVGFVLLRDAARPAAARSVRPSAEWVEANRKSLAVPKTDERPVRRSPA